MSKGWTDERRRKQAERIRQQKPWEKSTGPKSDAWKRASSQNAYKHGHYAAQIDIINALLYHNRQFVKLTKQLQGFKEFENFMEQTERKPNEINGDTPHPPENSGTN